MNFFVAKFATVTPTADSNFATDKNGRLPVIGTILAGIAVGSIVNGTIFQRENLTEGKMYLCENYRDEEYPDYPQTRIISEVSPLELLAMRKDLGEGKLVRAKASDAPAETAATVATVDESEVVAD